ncbi:redox-sensitive transcriptional activator SoxR [Aliiglaciecola lipolytica]|uniref:Redox-sensitive transcriptional activator SoxR n=1 Tax=Aliiglaciecola lipolytica E3 TaxID=1127673 RepID=K6WYT4_9ALTE|nr:redox-sensitive transcriptional activator SoxR [Aliiglaciecola lipolytica]GAC13614.1 MerR family transcriptional regulator, redox-sensitive transcriptional activator SoxR [Aliiglaciecola lipolytica E3]
MPERELSVGFVAKRCGVKVSTLHFYEQKELIKSWRNSGNQRRYKADVLRRVSVIKAAQKLGISLQDIKLAFASLPQSRTPNKQDWAALSRQWKQQLDTRIQRMQNLRDSLDGCIGCGCLSMKSCPIYNPNDELAPEGPGPVILER